MIESLGDSRRYSLLCRRREPRGRTVLDPMAAVVDDGRPSDLGQQGIVDTGDLAHHPKLAARRRKRGVITAVLLRGAVKSFAGGVGLSEHEQALPLCRGYVVGIRIFAF